MWGGRYSSTALDLYVIHTYVHTYTHSLSLTGYRYGKSLVPISDADEQAMKLAMPRCLSLLGFTSGENIKQHQLVGSSVQVIVPTPGDEVGNN